MKRLFFAPRNGPFEAWVEHMIREIVEGSWEDVAPIVDGFTVTNFTPTRTLNASTATVTQLANFLATMVDDIQKRGPNRDS